MKKIKVILLLACLPMLFFAQTKGVTLSGRVQGGNPSAAVAFANLVLKNSVDNAFVAGTITDEQGLFSFSDLKPGNYLLIVSYVGF